MQAVPDAPQPPARPIVKKEKKRAERILRLLALCRLFLTVKTHSAQLHMRSGLMTDASLVCNRHKQPCAPRPIVAVYN